MEQILKEINKEKEMFEYQIVGPICETGDILNKKVNLNNIEEEIGDLLITIVNLARFFDISADLALRKTNQKFYRRFNFIEKIIQKNNQKIEDISLSQLLNYWEKAKHEEK